MSQSVAFIGVGRMGANMARRLKDVGVPVNAVYDSHRPLAEELAAELGCAAPEKLADVTASADVIITVVTDDEAMGLIYFAEGDNLLVGAADKIFLNCATVTPAVHQRVEIAAEATAASSLEACMASSITQAREGTLYLMCGGKRNVYEGVAPLLAHLSKDCRYIGPAGSAAQVKALVNMVMNINTAALAEGLGLGRALGLDLAVLRDVFSQTGASSRVLETDGEDMQNRDHECYFSAAHAAKDSGIAVKLALDHGLTLPLSETTQKQYELLTKLGHGGLDKSGIAELTFPDRLGKR